MMATRLTDVVNHSNNMRYYYHFDPFQTKIEDFYFTETTLRLRQNWIDLFEFTEREIMILEQDEIVKNQKW